MSVVKSGKVLKNKKTAPDKWKKVTLCVKTDELSYSYKKFGISRKSSYGYEHVRSITHEPNSAYPNVFTVHLDDEDPLALKASSVQEAAEWTSLIRKQCPQVTRDKPGSNVVTVAKTGRKSKSRTDKAKKLRHYAKYDSPNELKSELDRLHMFYHQDMADYKGILAMANLAKDRGEAALHKAAGAGKAMNCALLIHYGADIQQLSKAGQSAGQLALENEFLAIGHILTQDAADPQTVVWELVREAFVDDDEGKKLRDLAETGNDKGVQDLLNATQGLFQETGVYLRCSSMDLRKAPVVDGQSRKHSPSRTALEKASDAGHDKVVDTLLTWGAMPTATAGTTLKARRPSQAPPAAERRAFKPDVEAKLLQRQKELRPDLAALAKSSSVKKTGTAAASKSEAAGSTHSASPLAVGFGAGRQTAPPAGGSSTTATQQIGRTSAAVTEHVSGTSSVAPASDEYEAITSRASCCAACCFAFLDSPSNTSPTSQEIELQR